MPMIYFSQNLSHTYNVKNNLTVWIVAEKMECELFMSSTIKRVKSLRFYERCQIDIEDEEIGLEEFFLPPYEKVRGDVLDPVTYVSIVFFMSNEDGNVITESYRTPNIEKAGYKVKYKEVADNVFTKKEMNCSFFEKCKVPISLIEEVNKVKILKPVNFTLTTNTQTEIHVKNDDYVLESLYF